MGESNLQDWQTLYSRNNERLSHLLLTKLWSDCSFLVGTEEREREEIKAHKFVLAMCSPVFETMFYGSIPEGEGPVEVTDIQPEAFKKFLKFLYTEDTTICSYQEASEIYCAAKKYMVPFVQERCSRYMQWSLTPKDACFALEFGKLFDENNIVDATLKTIKRKTRLVLKESSFCDASINTILEIFAQPELDIEDETDLFHALEKYAESLGLKNLKRNYDDPVCDKDVEQKRIKLEANNDREDTQSTQPNENGGLLNEEAIKEVRRAMPLIRFLTLPAYRFGHVANSTLIEENEAFAVMMNIAGLETPLPAGFSSSKENRGLRQRVLDYTPKGHMSPAPSGSNQATSYSQQNTLAAAPDPSFEAICQFSVPNFKTRKRPVRSDTFYTDDYAWQILVSPGFIRGVNNEEEKMLSIHVDCDGRLGHTEWSCQAEVTIELQKRVGGILRRMFTYQYNNNAKSRGYQNLMPWSTLCHVNDGYLRSNCLKVSAHVKAFVNNTP